MLGRSRELGLLGPGAVDDHVAHAASFADPIEPESRVLDLGAGGGVPGLVLAVARPDLTMTLLDAGERRVAFLRDAVRQLELASRVTVELGRAEELARRPDLREQFDAVVARSFGSPAVTAECAAGFVRRGGFVLVSEPPGTTERWPPEPLAELGLAVGPVRSGVRRLDRIRAGLDAVPRPVGRPARRPLF